jgi:hypothetical protein
MVIIIITIVIIAFTLTSQDYVCDHVTAADEEKEQTEDYKEQTKPTRIHRGAGIVQNFVTLDLCSAVQISVLAGLFASCLALGGLRQRTRVNWCIPLRKTVRRTGL